MSDILQASSTGVVDTDRSNGPPSPPSDAVLPSLVNSAPITANPVTIDAGYYQREFGFWREETLRLRAQVDLLVRGKQTAASRGTSTSVAFASTPDGSGEAQAPSSSTVGPTGGGAEVERPVRPDPKPAGLAFVSHHLGSTADPSTVELGVVRILKAVAYFVVFVLLAWRTVFAVPFFLLLPIVACGLLYFSGSVLVRSSY
ncbi:hypothetical protein JCM11491_002135 [Sporobolomyces phaffii]